MITSENSISVAPEVVIPADAGIHLYPLAVASLTWMPAFAGMTNFRFA